MQRWIASCVALFGLAGLAAIASARGAESAGEAGFDVRHVAVPAGDRRAVVRGNTALALDVYDRLRTTPGNLVFSPLSLSTTLAMASEGARGRTRAEMASVLHVGLPSSRLGRAFQSVLASLNPGAGEGVEIHVANAAWFDVEASFRPAFGRALDRHYGATVAQADFGSDPATARRKINEWGSEHTNGLIPEILSADARLGRGSFVLANAAHFRGAWAQPFSKVADDYFLRADHVVYTPVMRELGEFGLAEDADLLAVELPYVGREVSMVVLMPQHGRLAEFEATLTPESLSRSIAALAETTLMLHFPSFSVASHADLTDALTSLGMASAFDPRTADFSRAARGGGCLDAVGQSASLRVDAEGTVAAVVTVGTWVSPSQSVQHAPIVRVDSPFIFLVRHVATGTILFMGRVEDPTAQ